MNERTALKHNNEWKDKKKKKQMEKKEKKTTRSSKLFPDNIIFHVFGGVGWSVACLVGWW